MGVYNKEFVKPKEIVFVKQAETGYYEIALVDTSIPDFDVVCCGFSGMPELHRTKESAYNALPDRWKALPNREVTVSHDTRVMTRDMAFRTILGEV